MSRHAPPGKHVEMLDLDFEFRLTMGNTIDGFTNDIKRQTRFMLTRNATTPHK